MSFIQRFANALWVDGVTGVQQVSELEMPTRGGAPAHAVRVLQRVFGDRDEQAYFIVTDGLAGRSLGSKAPNTFDLFEVQAWVDAWDDALLNDVSLIGCFVHLCAAPNSPFGYGHAVSLGEQERLRGYGSFLLARCLGSEVRVGARRVDVPRVVPLLDGESLPARSDAHGGFHFLTELETSNLAGFLARWRGAPGKA